MCIVCIIGGLSEHRKLIKDKARYQQAEFEVKAMLQKKSENFLLRNSYMQQVHQNVVVNGMCTFNNQ